MHLILYRELADVEEDAEEDAEQLRFALAMSSLEMNEDEALNEALYQSLLSQQQEQDILVSTSGIPRTYSTRVHGTAPTTLSVSRDIPGSTSASATPRTNRTRVHVNSSTPSVSRATSRNNVSNTSSNDISNENFFFAVLILSALLYYAVLLFWELFWFFWHHPDFLSRVFLFVFCYVPYRCVPNSFSANQSHEEIFYIILFLSVLSYDLVLLVWQLLLFFVYHLESLLVIVFSYCLALVNFDFSSGLVVPLSSTI